MSENKIIKLTAKPIGFGDVADKLTPDMFVSKLPIQHSHSFYENDEIGLYIGVWDTTDMVEVAGPYPCDEFMTIIEGAVEVKNNSTLKHETVLAGESFVIPKGYDCQWHQSGYLRKFYVISEHPLETIPDVNSDIGVIKFQANKHCWEQKQAQYQDVKGRFVAGVEQHKSMDLAQTDTNNHLFVYLKSGALTLTESNGTVHNFKASDAFFIPAGTCCSWHASLPLVKHFVEIAP